MHGTQLIDAVIAKVKRDGFGCLGGCGVAVTKPKPLAPATLAKLRFPDGKPLSPALARWLAFDASWLGWKLPLGPLSIGDYAKAEYEMEWGYSALPLDGNCFGLHFGSDSRRLLYVGEPDSIGEYPVLLTDTDDDPYIGVEYPGIDVYLGVHSGVIEHEARCYGDMIDHPSYGTRMREHAKRYFSGKAGASVSSLANAETYDRLMKPLMDAYWSDVPAPPKAKPKAKPKPKPKRKR